MYAIRSYYDKGDCGACTVAVDGVPVLACISLALACHDGPEITTIEGVAERGVPHPLQDAFDVTGGAQCGFCTPGVLMSAWALLRRNPNPSRRITSYNVCYTKLLRQGRRSAEVPRRSPAFGRVTMTRDGPV